MARHRLSADEAAQKSGRPCGEVKAARSVRVPPDGPSAPSLPTCGSPWRARWHLFRLARVLHRYHWTTQLRGTQPSPLLRVFCESAPCIGESIAIVRGHGVLGYRASTGKWLAPCTQVELAADQLNLHLAPWISATCTAHRDK